MQANEMEPQRCHDTRAQPVTACTSRIDGCGCEQGMRSSSPDIDTTAFESVIPLIDALPFYVLIIDSEHTILATNKAVQKDLGRTAAELLGKRCPEVVHGSKERFPGCPLEEAVQTGQNVEREFFDNKTNTWVESMVYPVALTAPAGESVFLHFVRDITERKRLESALRSLNGALELKVNERTAELTAAYAQLTRRHQHVETQCQEHERIAISRERLARVGELSAGVAHSIRNPLHGLSNCVDLLRGRVAAADGVARELLDMMAEAMRRIDNVTHRLLRLTRDAPLHRAPTDVNRLIENALAFVQERARGKQLELATELANVPALLIDADRLIEGLINLIDNAIAACSHNGKITIRTALAAESPGALRLEIQDTGPGIPRELLEKVFDPFFTTKGVGEGSGLGLAITRRAVEEHGGQIQLESEPGAGTLVRVILPISPS